jgi:undecaprenyl-diphosphatase
MPIWTNVHKTDFFTFIVIPLLLIGVYWKKKLSGLYVVLGSILASTFLDHTISLIVKPFFSRPRPIDVIIRGANQGGFSFPSSHAADVFFLAFFLGHYFPKTRWPLILVGVLISYSRVYCGVHFPSDVIAGSIFGSIMALVLVKIVARIKAVYESV